MLTVVKRSLVPLASVAFGLLASTALGQPPAGPAPSVPSLPGPDAPTGRDRAGDARQTPAPVALSAQQLYEHVRRGVVALERNGVPVAIGTVLGGDGRILTSLSGLGGTDTADVRYADGTAVRAKLGTGDKGTDLALLVPQSGKWTEGLAASESDPVGTPLRAMLPARGARLGPAEAGIKGMAEAHTRDGAPLPVLDVDVKGPLVAGAPLLDAAGSVVAILVRACKGAGETVQDAMPWATWGRAKEAPAKTPSAPCTPIVVGAPVSAIRSFLAKAPATAAAPAPWLGIRVEPVQRGAVRGVRVVAVAPSSPAQKAALKPDADVIVAADGHPIDTAEALSDAIGKHVPGDAVKLLVFGEDKFREVAVALRTGP